jgi:hypothetical protein
MVKIKVIKKEDFGCLVVGWFYEVEVVKELLGVIHKGEVLLFAGVSVAVRITKVYTIRAHMMVFTTSMSMPRIEVTKKLATQPIIHTAKEPVI